MAKVMKKLFSFYLILSVCFSLHGKSNDIPLYKNPLVPTDDRVMDLLSRMTVEEKVWQLYQHFIGKNDNINNIADRMDDIPAEIGSLIYYSENSDIHNYIQRKAVEESRLGIPILLGMDVIHGFRTSFPIPLAQACSFNPELVKAAARVAAEEAYAAGIDWTFSPMIDVARDGRWGRISEGYGEDPYLTSVFAAATVEGYQGNDLSEPGAIASCLKHYVGYGASEAGRDYVPTEISRQSLWDTYLPPFKAGVEAGAATVMSAFNTISGVPATSNTYTLKDILKDRWGFKGFVVSDWDAVRQLIHQGVASDDREATRLAFTAGVDMDMCDNLYHKYLPELIDCGQVTMGQIDDAVSRILRLKFELGLFENPYRKPTEENDFLKTEYLGISEQLAQESMVLLKNEKSLLPLNVSSIAVVGPLADEKDAIIGNWRARCRPEDAVSIVSGIKEEFSKVEVIFAKGCDFDGNDKSGFDNAVNAAMNSDVVIVCLGEKARWSGENCSRSTICLPSIQEELLKIVSETGKPVVVLLSSGRPLDLTRIEPLCDAMMQIWQPGMRAGNAVAGLLSGKYNPSGRLAVTFPYTSGQIPIYYNHRNRARRGTQGYYQDIQVEPMYPFGHGLSYSTFEYSDIRLNGLEAEVTVTNTSEVGGKETVLWYITDKVCSIARPVKELKHFEKVLIPAGESRIVRFQIDKVKDLGFVDSEGNEFFEPGEFILRCGGEETEFKL